MRYEKHLHFYVVFFSKKYEKKQVQKNRLLKAENILKAFNSSSDMKRKRSKRKPDIS
jgi:hypothetical protein